jgi:hypothetical protein
MKLYIITCYHKSGYPIGDYHVVASSERKAKAALKVDEMCVGWIGKMVVESILSVVITN